MKNAIILFSALAASVLVRAESFEVNGWRVTGGGSDEITVSRGAVKLLGGVEATYFTEGYKKCLMGGRTGYTATREGSTLVFAKHGEHGTAEARVTCGEKTCDLSLAVKLSGREKGPADLRVFPVLRDFYVFDGKAFLRKQGRLWDLGADEDFGQIEMARIEAERPDMSVVFQKLAGTYSVMQDHRKVGDRGEIRVIAPRSVTGTEPCGLAMSFRWTVEDCFGAATVASRTKVYSQPLSKVVAVDVEDAGFEKGLDTWEHGATAAYDTAVRHSGKSSLRIHVDDPMTEPTDCLRLVPVVGGSDYEASIWIKTDDVRGMKGKKWTNGAKIFVEWADKNGKWFRGGAESPSVRGTTDWKLYRAKALKAPAEAGYACVFCVLRDGGTAWFDDFELKRVVKSVEKASPLPDETVATAAPFFRWHIGQGVRRYRVEFSRDSSFPAEKTFGFDAGGVTWFQLEKPLENGVWYWRVTAPGMDDINPWKLVVNAANQHDAVPPRTAARGSRVTASDGSFTLVFHDPEGIDGATAAFRTAADAKPVQGVFSKKLSATEAAFTFAAPAGGWPKGFAEGELTAADAAGNRAKKTFYFLNAPKPENETKIGEDGRYYSGGKRDFPVGIYEVEPKYFREVRDAGFDLVHLYRWEDGPFEKECRDYLDRCWATDGLRAFIGFDRGNRTGDGIVQGNFAAVARRVGALADHPGLYCWYLFDEPEVLGQFVSPGMLTEFADLVRALDPYHVVVMTTWDKMMDEHRRTWDTHWTQAYGLPPQEDKIILDHFECLRHASPITLLANCNCSEGWAKIMRGEKPDPSIFTIDYAAFRAMAFLGIVRNMNGLIWWWFARDTRHYLTAAQCPRAWADLVKVDREIQSLKPLVLADGKVVSGTAYADAEKTHKVAWWAKTVEGKTTFIAVNVEDRDAAVSIDVPGFGRQELKLSRYQVHIGKLKL